MFNTYYKTHLHINDMSQIAVIIAAIETIHQLGWKLTHLSHYGIIAHTDKIRNGRVQEVVIRRENDVMLVRSDNTAFGVSGRKTNGSNVAAFTSKFNEVRQHVTDDYAYEILHYYPLQFAHPKYDILYPERFSKIGKRDNILHIFKPVEGYFITPLLLLLNILVFALMVAMGGDIIEPSSKMIMNWGANFGPAVSGGEWWRLLSAVFLHIGIVHLLSNMIALGFIGFAIEPILGKKRFLLAYLLAGIGGSLFSIVSHPDVMSAGASGAIFGMYGVLLALLTTGIAAGRMSPVTLPITALYVLYQLAMGMKEGIDNAGHIGGLIAGILIGYAMYPSLKNAQLKKSINTNFPNTLQA